MRVTLKEVAERAGVAAALAEKKEIGGRNRIRTCDLLRVKQAL